MNNHHSMHVTDRERPARKQRKKLLLSGVLAALTISMFGFGASAAFTTTVADTENVASGTVALVLGADGPTNRLAIDATNIAAGDTIERAVDLTNAASLDLSAISLTTVASTSSLLDTDIVQGLQLTIESCSVPWTEGGAAPGYTYTCSGVPSTLVSQRPVVQDSLPFEASEAQIAGGTTHLVMTLELPAEADNTLQGQSSVIEYTFTGVQRAGTSR